MREIGRLVLAAGVGEAELQRRRAVKSRPAGGELNRHEHWSFWALVGIGHLNIAPRCHPDADASRIPNCSETVEGTLAAAPIDNSRDVKTLKHGGLQPMAQDYRTPLIRKGVRGGTFDRYATGRTAGDSNRSSEKDTRPLILFER